MVESKSGWIQPSLILESPDWGRSEFPITPFVHHSKGGKQIGHIGSYKVLPFRNQLVTFGMNRNELTDFMRTGIPDVHFYDQSTIQDFKNKNRQQRPNWAELYRERGLKYQERNQSGFIHDVYHLSSHDYTWFEKELRDIYSEKPTLIYRFTNGKGACCCVGSVRAGDDPGTLNIRVERKVSRSRWEVIKQLTVLSDLDKELKTLPVAHKDLEIVDILINN